MLSIFPDLLTFGLFAPFIIRVALGFYFIGTAFAAAQSAYKKKDYSIATWAHLKTGGIGGILVFTGFLTQIGALLLILRLLNDLYRHPATRVLSLLLLAMAASLLVSGAGFFAFDLPL